MKQLEDLAESINSDLKMQVVVAGSDNVLSDVKIRAPTSSYMLNLLLGGGVPLGRILEIFGDSGTGKSSVIEHMMIGFQKYPGISILLDSESGWCRHRAIAMGHNQDRHLAFECDTVELGVKVIRKTIEKIRSSGKFPPDMPVGIFWDTITASETEGEKSGDIYRDGIADKPRKMRAALRQFSFLLPRSNCSLVFVCQTMADIKAQHPGTKKSSSGGDAIKFWSTKRLKVWQSGRMKWPTETSGILATVETVKDKLEAPFRRIEIPVMFNNGIHNGYELLLFLIDSDCVKVSMSGARVHVLDFPEDGESVSFYMKQVDDTMVKYPTLVQYLSSLADQVWYGL